MARWEHSKMGVMDAIHAIRPLSEISGAIDTYSKINWHGAEPIPEADIIAKVKELQDAYDAKEYQRTREPEYPDIGDQLDDLYHVGVFSAEMATKLKAVKYKHPK